MKHILPQYTTGIAGTGTDMIAVRGVGTMIHAQSLNIMAHSFHGLFPTYFCRDCVRSLNGGVQ